MKEQPECRVNERGHKYWRLNGKHHREDGPAIEYADGHKEWWLNGIRHREDGPAVEWPDGTKYWYLHNQEVHPEQIVDLQLSRGTFCYYDKQSNELKFNA